MESLSSILQTLAKPETHDKDILSSIQNKYGNVYKAYEYVKYVKNLKKGSTIMYISLNLSSVNYGILDDIIEDNFSSRKCRVSALKLINGSKNVKIDFCNYFIFQSQTAKIPGNYGNLMKSLNKHIDVNKYIKTINILEKKK